MEKIFVDRKKCQGCKSCEIACAVEHSKSKNLYLSINETPKPKSRVVVTVTREGTPKPVRCEHCKKPRCLEVCESQAIYRDERGLVLVDGDRCTGCWKCVDVCPFKAIVRWEEEKKALICDYCRGLNTPTCLSACLVKAIYYCEPDEFRQRKL